MTMNSTLVPTTSPPEPHPNIPPGVAAAGAATLIVMSLALLLIAFPCVAALTRVRANYTPKAVNLGEIETYVSLGRSILTITYRDRFVGPRLTGVFSTLSRVKRLEGWYGIYRGELAVFPVETMLCSVGHSAPASLLRFYSLTLWCP